jgi:hypothetical protein
MDQVNGFMDMMTLYRQFIVFETFFLVHCFDIDSQINIGHI